MIPGTKENDYGRSPLPSDEGDLPCPPEAYSGRGESQRFDKQDTICYTERKKE